MPGCAVLSCKNSSKNSSKDSGISFHRFLGVDHDKREDWIRIIQRDRKDRTWLPSNYSYVCSAHFTEDDFYYSKTGRQFLKKSAVPCSRDDILNSQTSREASPSSLINVDISDCESIFDTPRKIKLKRDLEKATAAKQALVQKVKKLRRQNRYLRAKNKSLIEMMESMKTKNESLTQIIEAY